MTNRKPMLAGAADLAALRFPVLVSPKLDGVRALTSPDGLLSRALKKIPNVNVQEFLAGLPDGLDGELIVGPATAEDVYRRTVSVVMSDDAPIDGLTYHVFDYQAEGDYEDRRSTLYHLLRNLHNRSAVFEVPEVFCESLAEVEDVERRAVEAGYEGVMLRDPFGRYKHGRSTVKEGLLLKLKRFADSEARIIAIVELMHNGNAAETNELGRTKRSHKKEGLVPAGTMGALLVEDIVSGVQFEIGTGFSASDRDAIWDDRHRVHRLPLVKYKYFPVGVKDKPRHPVYLGWRAGADR